MASILSFKSDNEITRQLASWVAQQRLAQNLTQQDVYLRAGVAGSTFKKFEQSGECSLQRFVAILRAIGRLDVLDQILSAQPPVSPMQRLTGKKPLQRKRARKK